MNLETASDISNCFETNTEPQPISTNIPASSSPSTVPNVGIVLPDNSDTILDYAWNQIIAGNTSNDIFNLIKRAENLTPSYNYVFGTYGGFFYQKQDFKNAELNFLKAIELNKKEPYYYYHLSRLYYDNTNFIDGERVAKEGLLQKETSYLYQYLAYNQISLRKYNDSIENLKKSYSISGKKYTSDLFFIANSYYFLNKYQDSIDYYNQVISLSPCSYKTYYWRAKSYLELKNIEMAKNDLFYAMKLKPDVASIYYDLALIYYDSHELVEAKFFFKKSCQLKGMGCEFAK